MAQAHGAATSHWLSPILHLTCLRLRLAERFALLRQESLELALALRHVRQDRLRCSRFAGGGPLEPNPAMTRTSAWVVTVRRGKTQEAV